MNNVSKFFLLSPDPGALFKGNKGKGAERERVVKTFFEIIVT